MKPNKTLFGAFVISVTLIIGACQQTELSDSAPTPSLPAPAAEFVADDSDLSAGDAAAVARIFRNGNRPTRAGSDAVVRNVVTIRDAAGRPAIYAVNLQEGYLLISATKRCYPILAQIENGSRKEPTRIVWPSNPTTCPKMPISVSAKPLSATTLGSTPPTTAWSRELLRSNTMNREQRKARSSRRNGDNMHLIIHR